MAKHRIGTQEEWQAERDELLKEEKELTRRGDKLAKSRAEMALRDSAIRRGVRPEAFTVA